MKKTILAIVTFTIPLMFGLGATWAESYEQDYYAISAPDLLTLEELDDLLAPIALYPDPLIAQILPAATFVDQVERAASYVRQRGKSARIDLQPWDLSVKAVAHYPQVLFMMEENFDWTVSLGQAFIEQPQDVMDAIQRLRDYARAQGNLYSTKQQQVIYEADIIRIVPARPQYLYVPVYDPQVIYVESYPPSYPIITFGIGFTIGAWLNRDCDWRQRRVYYHGWRGNGWVNRSRPHIRDRRGIYINRRASIIRVNNSVLERDTRGFRQILRTDSLRRREERRLSTPPSRFDQPRRPERIAPARPAIQPRPGIQQPRPGIQQPRPGIQQQRPAIQQPRPQPRPGRIEQPSPSTIEQPRAPGLNRQGRGTVKQPAPTMGRQPPAKTVTPPTPVPRSRVAPPTVTPDPSPTVTPGPSPAATPTTPRPTVTPTPRPTVTPTPGPTVVPGSPSMEAPAPARPARPRFGPTRGDPATQPDGTPVPRAAPR